MDITRVSAISPVIRIGSIKSNETKTNEERKKRKAKEFEKTLKPNREEEVGGHAYN